MLINKEWDFETAVREISQVYRPGGLTTGHLRNRQIESWGQIVGKKRAVIEFDDSIEKYGSLSAFGKEFRVTVPILRHFREFFESIPDDQVADIKLESRDGMVKAFISYSWDNDDHKNWVRELATRLREDGIDITLDQWHLVPGDQLPEFMERVVRESDFVLIVCTHKYKERSNSRQGGVGYEGDIITAEIMTSRNQRKFIPILRQQPWADSAPNWLLGKYYIDLSSSPYPQKFYDELITTLLGTREKAPPIGKAPKIDLFEQTMVSTQKNNLFSDLDEIKITEIITDKVGNLKMESSLIKGNEVRIQGKTIYYDEISGSLIQSSDGRIFQAKDLSPNQKNKTPLAVILTALPVEYKAVRFHLSDIHEEIHPKGTIYEKGKFYSPNIIWDVGVVEIGKGNSSAAVETERAIQYFKPNIILFVGVAGGIKDVDLGDVVAGDKVYGYESGKDGYRFKPRPEIGLSSYSLVQRARAESKKEGWLSRITSSNSIKQSVPSIFVGPLAAGERVVSSIRSKTYSFIRSQYSDALAVEMEGVGFLTAFHANEGVGALVIRGISDLVSNKSITDTKGWQKTAAQNASAFAFEVLANISWKQTDPM